MKQLPPKKFCVPFVINEKPYCFWDSDVPEINLRFINQIDPIYFEYVAGANFSILENEDKENIDKKTRQYAAVTMRIAYSQALEVLFSFLFAGIQAHDCVVGWLLKYSNADLYDVVKKFNNSEKIYSKLPFDINNWETLAKNIFFWLEEKQKEELQPILKGFSRLWQQFAHDFLDEKFKDEYNSIKHGLRVQIGGFHFMMGRVPEKNGVPTAPEQMITMANSEFGTTFFVSERIENSPNYIVHTQSRNWSPENYLHGLNLISLSIKNILVFLKKINGYRESLEYNIPTDEEFYKKPWLKGSGMMSLRNNSTVNVTKIPLLTKDEILLTYKNTPKEIE